MSLQPLPDLPLISTADGLVPPSPHIHTDEDVVTWKTTTGYRSYLLFLHRLNDSVVGRSLPYAAKDPFSAAVSAILVLLDDLNTWIDEIPPLPTPQRFGNLAFRTWGKRLEDNANNLLTKLLPKYLQVFAPLLKPYFLISFGSFLRMDYGTGHETAFEILLLCLTLIRFFYPDPEEERHLVLVVFERYLQLCWRLQDVYKLEPAGSHGVWGLDDYSFFGYIFGSGQLRDQTTVPVSSILRPPLPPTNLYYLSISRIHQVKHGPFHEHSPQLHSIAVGVPNWAKVNSGLFKMYEAEVLGKRVVVQHIPLGGLLEWDAVSRSEPQSTAPGFVAQTHAPWAPVSSQGSMPTPVAMNTGMPPAAINNIPRWATSTVSSRLIDWSMTARPSEMNTTRIARPLPHSLEGVKALRDGSTQPPIGDAES